MIFLILDTCKNNATSASFLQQKIHSPSRFPSLFLNNLESFSAKLGEHVTLWFALTPPSLKWLTEQKNPKSLQSLQNAQRDTTNFAVILFVYNMMIGWSWRIEKISIGNSMICSDIWHKYHEWYFEIVIRNFPSR